MWLILSGKLEVLQAPMFDGPSLDSLSSGAWLRPTVTGIVRSAKNCARELADRIASVDARAAATIARANS